MCTTHTQASCTFCSTTRDVTGGHMEAHDAERALALRQRSPHIYVLTAYASNIRRLLAAAAPPGTLLGD